jgi:uncharacterized protein YjiS (DUF1127 family)
MPAIAIPRRKTSRATWREALPGAVFWLIETVALWQERRRQRLDLAALDPHMARDLGLTQTEIASEAAKPFWRA